MIKKRKTFNLQFYKKGDTHYAKRSLFIVFLRKKETKKETLHMAMEYNHLSMYFP